MNYNEVNINCYIQLTTPSSFMNQNPACNQIVEIAYPRNPGSCGIAYETQDKRWRPEELITPQREINQLTMNERVFRRSW